MKMAEVSPSEMAANACKARAETKPAATRGFGHTFGLPVKQGLYDPRNEHDACGVGFIAHMKGDKVASDRSRRAFHARKPDPSRRGGR
jgi:glutamate synthase (NADPH/NADH) large chain